MYARACAEGVCTPALQAEVVDVARAMETGTELALRRLLDELDANRDGRVSLAEALAAWETTTGADDEGGLRAVDEGSTMATLLRAASRAERAAAELERLSSAASLAVEGAVAAIDEDGDGKISVAEMVTSPKRIAEWLGVWSGLAKDGKVS